MREMHRGILNRASQLIRRETNHDISPQNAPHPCSILQISPQFGIRVAAPSQAQLHPSLQGFLRPAKLVLKLPDNIGPYRWPGFRAKKKYFPFINPRQLSLTMGPSQQISTCRCMLRWDIKNPMAALKNSHLDLRFITKGITADLQSLYTKRFSTAFFHSFLDTRPARFHRFPVARSWPDY